MIRMIFKFAFKFLFIILNLMFFLGLFYFITSLGFFGDINTNINFQTAASVFSAIFPEERKPIISEPDTDYIIATRKELANPEKNIIYMRRLRSGFDNPKAYQNITEIKIKNNKNKIIIKSHKDNITINPDYQGKVFVIGYGLLDYQKEDAPNVELSIRKNQEEKIYEKVSDGVLVWKEKSQREEEK